VIGPANYPDSVCRGEELAPREERRAWSG